MDRQWVYVIRVEGHLADRWSDWFDGLAIRNDPSGETTLTGAVSDQAALLGMLSKLHAMNLSLVSVTRIAQENEDHFR